MDPAARILIDSSLIFSRLRVEKAGGGWCPKQQVEQGIREYLQVDLGEVHVITGVQTQGRYDRGRGQEYTEEYTVEYWRFGLNEWKEYKRWDNKQVINTIFYLLCTTTIGINIL